MLLMLSASFFSGSISLKNSFKQFGSRSDPIFCWDRSGSKLIAIVFDRQRVYVSQLLTMLKYFKKKRRWR